FKIVRGPAHIELKVDPKKGPVLIEVGARLAGVRIPQEVKKYSNFDHYKATIEVFVKGETTFPKRLIFTRHFAVVLCPLLEGGTVKKISGIEEITKLSGYEFHLLSLKVGERVASSTHQASIPLLVFLAHQDRKKLMAEMKMVHELFQVEIK
ncbi:MAG TPA: hypothetical protein VLG44_08580, partial [Chlamydiales bacterium]|nr:hypothetical protein [Chlamydiales bacterium]